jgi:hypothetical protein
MSIKLILLKSGEEVIADVQEMVVGEESNPKVIGYFLNKPCIVKIKTEENLEDETIPKSFRVGMYPWIALSKDKKMPIPADWVVTMVEPLDNVTQMYLEDVLNNGKENDKDSSPDEQSDSDQSD